MHLCDAERKDRKSASDFIRFEALIELLQSRADPNLNVLDYLTNQFTPVRGHYVVARLLKLGHSVLTTNFDNLIELACESIGYSVSPVIGREDFSRFGLSNPSGRLLKLHGSLQRIKDGEWTDSRKSIQATLRAIGQYSLPPHIDKAKKQAVWQAVNGRYLVVMGYSGFDDFDICPMLVGLPSVEAVLWVTYSTAKERLWTWEHLDNALKNRDKELVDQEGHFWRRDHAVLHQLGTNLPSIRPSLFIVEQDTRKILTELNHIYQLCTSEANRSSQVTLDAFMQSWAASYLRTRYQGLLLGGLLLASLRRLDPAIKLLKQALSLACKSGDFKATADCHVEIGQCLAAGRLYCQAKKHYNQAIEVLRKRRQPKLRAKIDYSVAQLHRQWEVDYTHSIKLCRRSMKTFAHLGEDLAVSGCHHEMGVLLQLTGNYAKAFGHFAKNGRLSRLQGSIGGYANALGQMAVVRRKRGEYGKALRLQERCHELFQGLGMHFHVATSFANFGLIYQESGNLDRAAQYYQKALETFQGIPDSRGIARTLNQLGVIAAKQGYTTKALDLYRKSLRLKRDDQLGKATTLGLIGKLYQKQGDHRRAIRFCCRSLRTKIAISDPLGTAHVCQTLARAYFAKDDLREAARFAWHGNRRFLDLGVPDAEQTSSLLATIEQKIGTAAFKTVLRKCMKVTNPICVIGDVGAESA